MHLLSQDIIYGLLIRTMTVPQTRAVRDVDMTFIHREALWCSKPKGEDS